MNHKSVQLGSDGLAIEPPTVTSSVATRWTHRKPSTGAREPRIRQSTPLLVLQPLSGGMLSPGTLSASSSSSSVTQSTASAVAPSISPSSSSAPLSPRAPLSHHGHDNRNKTSKSVPVSPKRYGMDNTGMGKSTSAAIFLPPTPTTPLPPFSVTALTSRVASNGKPPASSSIVLPPTVGAGPVRVDVGVPRKNTWKYLELVPSQVECPRCHLSSSTVPCGYWKERDELILMCGALFADRLRPTGYRICGTHWTPSERVPVCECGAVLDIECHHRNYIYVCPSCHSMSHTSRRGDPPKISIKDMS